MGRSWRAKAPCLRLLLVLKSFPSLPFWVHGKPNGVDNLETEDVRMVAALRFLVDIKNKGVLDAKGGEILEASLEVEFFRDNQTWDPGCYEGVLC